MDYFKELFSNSDKRIIHPNKEDTPRYYQDVLEKTYFLMMMYMLFCFLYSLIETTHFNGTGKWFVIWFVASACLLYQSKRVPVRVNILMLVSLLVGWICYTVFVFGWNCGTQHFIMPLMVISMFSVFDSGIQKCGFCIGLLALRIGLFFWQRNNNPLIIINTKAQAGFQVISTFFVCIVLCVICFIISANIQDSEKMLLVYNHKLKRQASRDPLTDLYNRRTILNIIHTEQANKAASPYCIAIGDIDFFKNVNDTYGHNFGDDVLRALSAIFKEQSKENGSYVCRWGGEEFLFYLPEMNLDDAGTFMNKVLQAVKAKEIIKEDVRCRVSMTFGVEDYDYTSSLEQIIKQADQKLYYGKEHGRNQVVI